MLKELHEKRHTLAQKSDEVLERAGRDGWTTELRAEFDTVHADLGHVGEMIEAHQRNAQAKAIVAEARGEKISTATDLALSDPHRQAAIRDAEEGGSSKRFLKWARGGFDAFSREDRQAYASELESRALSLVDAEGGFLVPEEMVRTIENALLSFGGMRETSTVIKTRAGNPLNWPTNNDTTNVGEIIGINAAHNELDPVFAEVSLGAFKYSSGIVRVPIELLQDEFVVNFEGWLGETLGTRIARIFNTHQTVGAGTTLPLGIVPSSALGHTALSATAITAGDLLDLMHSVDPAYAQNGTWQMNWTVLGQLRALTDTTGIPIWNGASAGMIANGAPATIYGRPYVINQDLADPAIGTKPIIFGDLSKYLIRDVLPIQLNRTTELYWANSQVGFLAIARMDSVLLDAGTDPVKHLLMAAA